MSLQGNWNKETMIRKTLEETPATDAEWIMWVDIDTVMPDMAVLPRFEDYEGYNLVVWGNRDKIMEGDMNAGANLRGSHELCTQGRSEGGLSGSPLILRRNHGRIPRQCASLECMFSNLSGADRQTTHSGWCLADCTLYRVTTQLLWSFLARWAGPAVQAPPAGMMPRV